ncbi:hypothetical protein ADZ36_24630 [Streptomyces fradiae]|uniref:Uncharacterized protein n=1 Tax=Streptomyces fradiae TaxID=1906 RepID=A0ACC4W612_STRFR|nr:hypothetical protein ADZ36_24630 [Streptomyces fradiae]OFA58164.1 hypothetical protein BEN35_04235 [Streptomyces fradiae]
MPVRRARVHRAGTPLDRGAAPAGAAAAVGFADRPHPNRHCTRIAGVPPGAYRRERERARAPGTARTSGTGPDAAP